MFARNVQANSISTSNFGSVSLQEDSLKFLMPQSRLCLPLLPDDIVVTKSFLTFVILSKQNYLKRFLIAFIVKFLFWATDLFIVYTWIIINIKSNAEEE